MTEGANMGAEDGPDVGAVTMRHALFSELGGNGWFYNQDSKRGPYDAMRNPGDAEYSP